MSIAPSSYRRRVKRGGSLEGPQGFWGRLAERMSRSEVLVRLAMCLGAASVLLVVLHGWSEPLPFRVGSVPPRGVVARVPFERPDPERTRTAQERAAAQVRVVYSQDRAPLVRLRDRLKNRVAEIAAAETLASVSRTAWLEFAPDAAPALELIPVPPPGDKSAAPAPPESAAATQATATEPSEEPADPPAEKEPPAAPEPSPEELAKRKLVSEAEKEFERFRGRLDSKEKQIEFDKAIDRAFADVEKAGVLEKIQHGIDEGSQTEIDVHPLGESVETVRVPVSKVLLGEAKVHLKGRIEEELGKGFLADRVASWIEPRLSGSLEIDRDGTSKAKKDAIEKTPQQFVRYAAGDVIAEACVPVTSDALTVLGREHDEYVRQQDARSRAGRAAALFGLFVAMFTLAGFYIHLQIGRAHV